MKLDMKLFTGRNSQGTYPCTFESQTEKEAMSLKTSKSSVYRPHLYYRVISRTFGLDMSRVVRYRGYTKNPGYYMAKQSCVRNLLFSNNRAARFTLSGKLNESADDRCIDAIHPCAYLAKYEEKYIICIVPLPTALRQGKVWTETSFWIQ
jgi:hypothetical protein